MARSSGVIGGLFTLLGAAGVCALWIFILGPHTTILYDFSFYANIGYQVTEGIPAVTGKDIVTPYSDEWNFFNDLYVEFAYFAVLEGITSPQFLNIDAMYLMYGSVGVLVVGGILAFAAAVED